MPWRERSPMDERLQFVADHTRHLWSMTELCDRYGVSRMYGLLMARSIRATWRGGVGGPDVAPATLSPQTTDPAIARSIIDLRRRERWGAQENRGRAPRPTSDVGDARR